ncbi:hypothetical protein HZZ13_34860 [Bradyrhizobium sp. CNPSo 4010]|uniref:Uncharacterized protein n=1 Tax=Bradyrhizobium agreste TaxID=2751811 RepID=A0ABS0Q1B6_9BRAD|nr:hypothetical protein [Bradyrhizobium agreste]MBH5402941.1 hypothetical protein [Bradyrhizobium agreste]
MHVTTTFETASFAEELDAVALADAAAAQQSETPEATEPVKRSSRKSITAFALCALAINGAAAVLLSLRQSITDERIDVKKISSQLSTLMAKVDALQSTMMSDVTSSIRRSNARYGFPAMRKRVTREVQPLGPVSVGGAPLTVPAATPDS